MFLGLEDILLFLLFFSSLFMIFVSYVHIIFCILSSGIYGLSIYVSYAWHTCKSLQICSQRIYIIHLYHMWNLHTYHKGADLIRDQQSYHIQEFFPYLLDIEVKQQASPFYEHRNAARF